MSWEEMVKKLEEEIKQVHELIMEETDAENMINLAETMRILTQLHERNFGR